MRRSILLILISVIVSAGQNAPAAPGIDSERALESAESLMRAGKVAAAATAYERIIRQRPHFAEAYFALGVSYAQLGKLTEAASALRSYLKLSPNSADGHAMLGILLLGNSRIAEARPELEEALRLDSSQTEAAKALGRVYNIEGVPAKVIPLVGPLVKSPAADDEARRILARALLSTGDVTSANVILSRMLAAGPKISEQTYLLAGMAAKDAGDISKALEICERGLRAYPMSERIEGLYGSLPPEVLVARTKQRAERLERDPNDVDELIAIGRLMIVADQGRRSGALDAASNFLARAVELDPTNAMALFQDGRCLRAQTKTQEALAVFRKALPLARNAEMNMHVLAQIGVSETALDHAGAAREAFEESLRINRKLESPVPEDAFEYYKFLRQRGGKRESDALISEILRWEPLYAPALLERARELAARQQPQKAIEDALLVTKNSEDPELLRSAHYFLVKTYHSLGEDKSAEVHAGWITSHH